MPALDARTPALAPHQRTAVDRLIDILRIRRGAVLADEPGLGKTWVAAAVAAIGSRERYVEVVSPAPLRDYWMSVLREFGVMSTVMSHESLARDRIPCETSRKERLVIVDEAHRFRNSATKRYAGLARMSINARLLLVTATPACNAPVDLLSLLRLIVADDELVDMGVASISGSFVGGGPELGIVLDELLVRRLAREIEGLTPSRKNELLHYEPVERSHELQRRFEALTFPWMSRKVSRDLLLLFLQRRLESSVAALAATIRRMSRLCHRARILASRGAILRAANLRAVLGDPESSTFQDILFPQLWGAHTDETPRGKGDFEDEIQRLEEISKCLVDDAKVALLEDIVRSRRGTPGLVFTVSYDTAAEVFGKMARSFRCALLTGRRCVVDGRRRDLAAVISSLNAGEVELVVATDVGGEGLNLEAAGYVVHYDQPWNPAILDQRNGRICRIGQRRGEVESFEFVARGSRSRGIVRQKRAALARLWSGDRAVEVAEFELPRRWQPPSRLEANRIQVRLVRLLRARGLASGEIVELLSVRHREGVERLLERFLRQPFDTLSANWLRTLLLCEQSMISRRGRGCSSCERETDQG